MSPGGDVADFLLSSDTGIQRGLSRLSVFVDGLRVDPEGYADMGHQIRQGGIGARRRTPSRKRSLSSPRRPARRRGR